MNAVTTKTFKSGNSIAVRLPKDIAFADNTSVLVERTGDVVTIRPVLDAAAEKRKLVDLVEALRRLPKPPLVEKREPPEPPERPGL
jgi:antitoxin VapB